MVNGYANHYKFSALHKPIRYIAVYIKHHKTDGLILISAILIEI